MRVSAALRGIVGVVSVTAWVLACTGEPVVSGLTPPPIEPPNTEPAVIRPISGDHQSAQATTLLPLPLIARIFDSTGIPVPGIDVSWAIVAGRGILEDAESVTDSTGTVRANWHLGDSVGTQKATLASSGLPTLTFTSQAVAVLTSLVLVPNNVLLLAGAQQQYLATPIYSDGVARTTAIQYTATGGTIDTAGLYTAGVVPGSYRVIASAESDAVADTVSVSVALPTVTLRQVLVNPATPTVNAGTSVQFTASGVMSDGSTITPSVVWSTGAGGIIDNNGYYTAGLAAGNFTVTATALASTLSGTTTVTVNKLTTQAPDLLNQNFDNGNFGWVTNFPGGTPRHRVSQSGGVNGSPALEAFWGPGLADYSPADFPYASGSHRFVRLYFKLTTKMLHGSSNVKVFRFTNPNRGGIFSNPSQSWGFGFDNEAQSVTAAIGIFEGAPTSAFLANVGSRYVTASNIAGDGKFHWIEIEYDRNAPGGLVEVRIWFDGTPVVMPASASKGAFANDGYFLNQFAWKGGVVGQTPSTLWATRQAGSPTETSSFGPIEEYSGGILSTGSMFVDNVAVSTTRIGP